MENLNPDQEKLIILFDGVCNLCSSSVQFVLRWEKNDDFRFAALQSEYAIDTLRCLGMDMEKVPDSIVLIDNGVVFFASDAALKIARRLKFPMKLLYLFIVFPRFLRNPVYNWIAKNRYRWFGMKESCWMPDKSYKNKFI